MSKNTSKSVEVKAKSNPTITTNGSAQLSTEEKAELKQLENQISENYASSFKLAAALAQIRDQKLYRVEYKSFEEYCRKRWEYSRSYCQRLIDMNSVMIDLEGYEDTKVHPRNEAQARVFVGLDKKQRLKLAESVSKKSDEEQLTAAVFSKHKKKLFPDLCTAKPKEIPSVAPVIDVQAPVERMPDLPSLAKLVESGSKVYKGLVDQECDEGEFPDLLREFIKEATSWIEWEKQSKAKQN